MFLPAIRTALSNNTRHLSAQVKSKGIGFLRSESLSTVRAGVFSTTRQVSARSHLIKYPTKPFSTPGPAFFSSKISLPLQSTRGYHVYNARRGFRLSDSGLLYTLIGANVAVYGLWQYGIASYQRFRDGSLFYFLQKNFLLTLHNIKEGRLWTTLTYAFSHMDFTHIGFNMFALWTFGPPVLAVLGQKRFLTLYLGSALAGALGFLCHFKYYEKQRSNFSGLGASGSVMGVMSMFALLYPTSTVLIFFIIPAPAILAVGAFAAYDMLQSYRSPLGKIGHAAHVGGTLFGVGYYFARIRPLLRRL
ncbi:rhomboid-domain-containing protein [Basidiobolus meristosporus CBS 931.73]|uniref:Rhomboid-domain-containing protein n=1 Tax=Basidiobolus meristosporus CBS 931.73 TaxID=1314790 RepID=A0A1Y1YVA0_9FUNG|nr:rhomboid-domain-containing protein [Basidiobolus meristosporus CBS 931.73]|eukprot:ORY01950.1 rhomboid-domain-containing protein [Basidiobolus meristosporus CBS 931.73]